MIPTTTGTVCQSSSRIADLPTTALAIAALDAGIIKEADAACEVWFDERDHALHFGPYAIPGPVVLNGVPAMIQFMLKAKAEVEIAQKIAVAPLTLPIQDAIYDAARPSLDPSAAKPVTLYGTHYDLTVNEPPSPIAAGISESIIGFASAPTAEPEVYGSSEADEYGRLRMSDWIQTYTGVKFHVLEPRPEDIKIEDIAHALSLVNRYTGHTRTAYSVAEHSVRVMWCVRDLHLDAFRECSMSRPMSVVEQLAMEMDMLAALLHDASEAYLADIARPIKMIPAMQPYRDMEATVEKAVFAKWGLPYPMNRIIKRADEVLLVTEKRDLMGPSPAEWIVREKPLVARIYPWTASLAEARFMKEYKTLMGRLKIEV